MFKNLFLPIFAHTATNPIPTTKITVNKSVFMITAIVSPNVCIPCFQPLKNNFILSIPPPHLPSNNKHHHQYSSSNHHKPGCPPISQLYQGGRLQKDKRTAKDSSILTCHIGKPSSLKMIIH